MKAAYILSTLIKESVNLESVGKITIPDENWHDYLRHMFGPGTRECFGFVRPNCTYLYCYSDELDAIYDLLLRNDEGNTITLVKVDE